MSDSDTTDSDSGIRFKTASTRYKSESTPKPSSSRRSRDDDCGRRRESDSRRSDRHERSFNRSRSRSRDRRRDSGRRSDRDSKRHRSRSRSHGRSSRRSSPDLHKPSSSSRFKPVKEETRPISADRAKPEPTKILDISTSSLSSQDDHLTKETVDDHFGPALPPALLQQNKPTTSNAFNHHDKTEDLPEVIGPALPPHLYSEKAVENLEASEEDNVRVIGPALPANFVPPTDVAAGSSESELSPFSEEEPAADDEDDLIGPIPGASSSRSHLELEQRALEMKLKRLDGYDTTTANVTSREDWMLELPDVRKVSDMGLGARQFRTREKLEMGDRSVWTDTPSDRERKKAGHPSKETKAKLDREEEQEKLRNAERDKQQEEMVKRHKKKHKRDKSLLDLHQKKAKKEKKDKEKSSEPSRRPFDRNVDLHANRFDEAQKKAIFKKAQLLDTRFSSGASKFL